MLKITYSYTGCGPSAARSGRQDERTDGRRHRGQTEDAVVAVTAAVVLVIRVNHAGWRRGGVALSVLLLFLPCHP